MRWLLVLLLTGCTANAQIPHTTPDRHGWQPVYMPYPGPAKRGPNGEVTA